jgi:hypothetical protein
MCIRNGNTNKIEHYYNRLKLSSSVLLASNPTVGLTSSSLTNNNDQLVCKFTRDKKNAAVTNYADAGVPHYLFVSSGPIWAESKSTSFNISKQNFYFYLYRKSC